jgi:hypothetical protein
MEIVKINDLGYVSEYRIGEFKFYLYDRRYSWCMITGKVALNLRKYEIRGVDKTPECHKDSIYFDFYSLPDMFASDTIEFGEFIVAINKHKDKNFVFDTSTVLVEKARITKSVLAACKSIAKTWHRACNTTTDNTLDTNEAYVVNSNVYLLGSYCTAIIHAALPEHPDGILNIKTATIHKQYRANWWKDKIDMHLAASEPVDIQEAKSLLPELFDVIEKKKLIVEQVRVSDVVSNSVYLVECINNKHKITFLAAGKPN